MRYKIPSRQPASFRASALYLAGRAHGVKPDRVAWMEARNLESTDTVKAAARMEALAAQNTRCKTPRYHFVITFDPKDAKAGKVDEKVMREIADKTIERMGLQEHQLLIYAHRDTNHPHMHFLVNRISPLTGKAWSREDEGRRLVDHCRDMAREYGLTIAKERNRGKGRSEGLPSDAEYWKARREGREPQVPFGREELADLRADLKGHFFEAKSWDELTQRLERQGISLHRKGQGLMVTDGDRFAKLSDMGKGVRFAELEKRFGERFDDFMVRQTRERVGDRMSGAEPGDRKSTRKERETAEKLDGVKPFDSLYARAANPVQELDNADMEFRFWSGVEASYRHAEGRIEYGNRRTKQLHENVNRQQGWLTRREASLMDGLSRVYRDPNAAFAKWAELEKSLGGWDADRAVAKNPLILGNVRGFRFLSMQNIKTGYRRTKKSPLARDILKDLDMLGERTAARREAQRMAKYLVERREKWRDAKARVNNAQAKVEKARRDLDRTLHDFKMLQKSTGVPKRLRATLMQSIKRRARALNRVNEKMIREAKIADERKEQLYEAWRRGEARKIERSRRRERGRAFGLELDFFDD